MKLKINKSLWKKFFGWIYFLNGETTGLPEAKVPPPEKTQTPKHR